MFGEFQYHPSHGLEHLSWPLHTTVDLAPCRMLPLPATVPSLSSPLSSGIALSPRAVSFHHDNQQHTQYQHTFTLNFTSACVLQYNSSFVNTVHNRSSTGSLERDFTVCSNLVVINPYLTLFCIGINTLLKEDSPEMAFFWSQLITDNEDPMCTLCFKISLMSHDCD